MEEENHYVKDPENFNKYIEKLNIECVNYYQNHKWDYTCKFCSKTFSNQKNHFKNKKCSDIRKALNLDY